MPIKRGELETFYDKHEQSMFICALSITKNAAMAEDAVQNSFSRLISAQTSPDDLKCFIFRSIRNSAIDLLRKEKGAVDPSAHPFFQTKPNPRDIAIQQEFQTIVEDILLTFPQEERETILQHVFGDLTFREIAEIQDISINTVMSWYRRSMGKLRDQLKEREALEEESWTT